MYTLRAKSHFDAAHYIKDYPGKCSREHGHRWDVEVVLEGQGLDKLNMLIDFVEVKSAMKDVIDSVLDHYQLNETLGEKNLTAEFLANWVFRQLTGRLYQPPGLNVSFIRLVEVTIWESPDCSVTYKGG